MGRDDDWAAPVPEVFRNDPDRQPSGVPKPASNVMVARPTTRQLAVFGQSRQITCATCKHFRHHTGQQVLADTDFVRSLPEQGWKKEHLGHDPEHLAICDQHGDMVVGPHTLACDLYKRR